MNSRILLPKDDLSKIARMQTLVAMYRASGASIEAFAKENGVSSATLWRWNRKAGADLDPENFLDQRKAVSGSRSRIDRRCLAWALCLMEKHPAAPMTEIHLAVCEKTTATDWIKPGYKQLCRALSHLPKDVEITLKEGAREGFEQARLVVRREETIPNQLWGLDFSTLPIRVRDLATGELYQPHMTTFIDYASRVVMGYRIHRAVPDADEAIRALHMALLPKKDERWPCFGVPANIRTDHGSIYESTDFLQTLLDLKVIWDPAPVESPSANGKVERWFGTAKLKLFTMLAGHTRQYRGLSRAEEEAMPDSDLPEHIEKFIYRYNHSIHSALGRTPHAVWRENAHAARGLSVPKAVVEDALRVRKVVKIQRDGVHLYGLHFMAESIVGMVGTEIEIRLPIDATANSVEAWTTKGSPLGSLRPVDHDSDLAAQINALGSGRKESIQELGQTMREIVGKPPVPASLPADAASASPDDIPLRPSPKLPVEDI